MTVRRRPTARRTAFLALCLAACGAEAPAQNTAPTAFDSQPSAGGASASAGASGAPTADPAPARVATAPTNGYGDRIAWRGFEEGLRESAELGRPLMLVVHAAWCPRCKELRRRFFDPALAETSERFVMVNVDQDETPESLRYGPDGQYIPRVVFLDPQGNLDAALSNPARRKYKYFYTPHDDLVAVMKTALDRHGKQ